MEKTTNSASVRLLMGLKCKML